jgi:hypothetical protein
MYLWPMHCVAVSHCCQTKPLPVLLLLFSASAPYIDLTNFVPTRFMFHLSPIGVTGDGEGGLHVQDSGGEQPKGPQSSYTGR